MQFSCSIATQCIIQSIFFPSLFSLSLLHSFSALLRIIPGRLLASLQLLKVVPTSAHITTRLVETLGELRRIGRTRSRRLVLVAALAVVQARVHRLSVRVRAVVLVGGLVVGLSGSFLGGRAAAAEEPADGMSNGRADCNAAEVVLVSSRETGMDVVGLRSCGSHLSEEARRLTCLGGRLLRAGWRWRGGRHASLLLLLRCASWGWWCGWARWASAATAASSS